MPVVEITQLTRPEHVVEYLADYIDKSNLGFAQVVKYDDAFRQAYPAVQILPGGFQKDLHGTHTWLLTLRADIYIMHAKLTEDRQTRNYEDLVLATSLVSYLEADLRLGLGNGLIAGWVEKEDSGRMPPRSAMMPAIVSTLLQWRGTNEARF